MKTIVLAGLVFAMAGCASQLTPGSPAVPSFTLPNKATIQLQTLDVPIGQFPAAIDTTLTGIRGNIITAGYTEAGGATVGVVYNQNTATWAGYQFPGAASTVLYGPDVTTFGFRAVGSYKNPGSKYNQGMIYDSVANTYTTLNVPPGMCSSGCNETIAHSIYGDVTYKVVGNYDSVQSPKLDGSGYPATGHAFLYDSTSGAVSSIDIAGAASSTAYGIWIDGSTVAVAGGYTNKKGTHAYVRSLASSGQLVTYDYPGAAITHFEGITGAGGAGNYNLCGDYSNVKKKNLEYGFFIPVRNWKAGKPVVIGKVSANSVYNQSVIGVYVGAGQINGYIAQIP